MPTYDIFHKEVRSALETENWTVTDDPLYLRFGEDPLYIDLAAEKIIGAEKAGRKIAIEVKSFVGVSFTTDFHLAVGQFVNYRIARQEHEPARILYLAVPVDTYKTYFVRKLAQAVLHQLSLKLIVFDPQLKEIVEWID